jgi:hypothetical protein
MSESLLGTGAESSTDPALAQAAPQTVYRFLYSAPLTEDACDGATSWNVSNRRGFSWANGEYRTTLYNHYYPPNHKQPDCMGVMISGAPAVMYTGFGWRAARSRHSAGVNVLSGDGASRFVSSQIDLLTWRAVSTRAGGETLTLP